MQVEAYLCRPLTQVRRRDRVLDDDEWLDRLLLMGAVGHLALCWDGQPYLHSNVYWYDGLCVYGHTAGLGWLRALLEAGAVRGCRAAGRQAQRQA